MGLFFKSKEEKIRERVEKENRELAKKSCWMPDPDDPYAIKHVYEMDNKGRFCFNEKDHMVDFYGRELRYNNYTEAQLVELYDLGKSGYNISAYTNPSIPPEMYKEFAKLEKKGMSASSLYQISECCYRDHNYNGFAFHDFDEHTFSAWVRAYEERIPLISILPGDPNSWYAPQISAMHTIYKAGDSKLFKMLDSSFDPALMLELSYGSAKGIDMTPYANPLFSAKQAKEYRLEQQEKRKAAENEPVKQTRKASRDDDFER